MALVKRDEHWYGEDQGDIRIELIRYSELNSYLAEHFADAACPCGSKAFRLQMDEGAGVAVRTCPTCGAEHPIGDSEDYLADAEFEECECLCGGAIFEVTAGVALYEDSEDVKWIYLGCRCVTCGLTACYGDWKNEADGYRELLDRV
ncbi:hypothetical protein P12x_002616 [Tundrisphaera lichenicola]|uniref:hypothetical protein n=1 Tax=Tundrisphaera lichenicola TaxID=2029860 RepID=UPI003EB7524F